MKSVERDRLAARLEAVMDLISEITGENTVSEACSRKLRAMSFDELGTFALALVTSRSVEQSFTMEDAKSTPVAT